jgi:demethylmenaquinone methyltransferase/2-methoxy-6-polyprenyl-1,4-benzoquinol methylase
VAGNRTRFAERLFAPLGPTYEQVGARMSLGQDPRWRRFLASRIPHAAGAVLDVATGTAAVTVELLRAAPHRSVVGLDLSEPMVRTGVERVRAAGLAPRARFVLAQAEHPPFGAASFDGLTFTYLFRYVDDPAATLRALVELVRPGGTIASLEFGVPSLPWYPGWWTYTRAALPLIGRATSSAWGGVGRFLGPDIERYARAYPLDAQVAMWRAAGIDPVHVRRLTLGAGVVIWGRRSA